jgi:hypothetical protein
MRRWDRPFKGLPTPQGSKLSDKRPAVGEETPIPLAEVVEARFTIGCPEETILRAPAIALSEHRARPTITGEGLRLGLPEGSLTRTFQKIDQSCLADISQPVFPIDEVVAGKKIPVMFDNGNITAGLAKDAKRVLLAEGRVRGFLEYLHPDPLDVPSLPFIEDSAEKTAPGFRRHGEPTDTALTVRSPFHQGQKAQVLSTDLLEKPIYLEWMLNVIGMYDAEDIAQHPVLS